VFHNGQLVATHARAGKGKRTDMRTTRRRRSRSMRTPTWCRRRAAQIGPACTAVVAALLEVGALYRLRSAQGVLGLADRYGKQRLELACAKATTAGDPSYRTVKGILAAGVETDPPPAPAGDGGAGAHLHGPAALFGPLDPLPGANQPKGHQPGSGVPATDPVHPHRPGGEPMTVIDVALHASLRTLKLSGMLETLDARLAQAQAGELGHLDFLQVLCQDEITRRETMSIHRRLRRAHFDEQTTLEGFDFAANPKLPTAQIRDLAALRWLHSGQSVLLHGPAGVGKPMWHKHWDTWPSAKVPKSASTKPAEHSPTSPVATPTAAGPNDSPNSPESIC
jgi:hypothetical protein